ncbi:MAG: hypothetical protein QOH21_1269, partial [Acidobacteriota bacterium]|nr:hypothetical protein [Acidobacteriota bacterium]
MTTEWIPRLQRSLGEADDALNEVALFAGDVPDPGD